MIGFALSDEQRALRAAAATFAEDHLVPNRAQLDHHDEFPTDLMQLAYDAGFVSAYLPVATGGQGRSLVDLAILSEEIAYGDLGFATSLFVGILATGPLVYFGTEEQRQRWLAPLSEELRFCSLAMTEPDAGTAAFSLVKTTARPVEGGYVINGEKCFITNASLASFIVVFARVDPGPQQVTAFVVPGEAPGVTVNHPYQKMGLRASDTCQVILEDVFVANDQRIGDEGQGAVIALTSLNRSRTLIGAMSVGISRAARDLVVEWGYQRRTTGNVLLITQQDFRFRLAQIDVDIDTAQLMSWRASWAFDTDGPRGAQIVKYASAAKLVGGEVAVSVTNQAVEMLGGKGFMAMGQAEKLMRDAKALQIYEGPPAIQKTLISEYTVKRRRRKRKRAQ